jgi:MoxR-like ATPase
VLHEHETGGIVILVEGKSARKWKALIGNTEGWKFTGNGAGGFDSTHTEQYHEANGGVTYELPEPELSEIQKVVVDPARAANTYDLAYGEYIEALKARGAEIPEDMPAPKTTTGYSGRAKKADVTSDEFSIDPPNPDRYWFESERDTRAFKDFVATRLAGYDTNAMIVGASGFGKTQGVIRLGERLSVPVHVVNCQIITTTEKWLGQMMADSAKGTFFEVSEHLQYVERTHPDCEGAEFCIILYDELTRLRPELGNALFSLLDGQQGLGVPQMGRRVVMDGKNVVFATANIGSAYTGTFAMDYALRRRFDWVMERPFPPAEEELLVITTAHPKVTEEKAKGMIAVAEHTRTLWKAGELESPISTAHLLSWARAVAGGYSVKDAAEYTVIPGYTEDGGSDSDRAKVKMSIEGLVA